jgi:tRNA G10  N-methylase Trm11
MKTFNVEMQVNHTNNFVIVTVTANNQKDAWAKASKMQRGIVVSITEVK